MSEDQRHLPVPASSGSSVTVRPMDRFFQATLLHAQVGRWINALRRWWWIPLLSLLVLGGPGVILSALTPKTFRSQAVLWLGERLQLPEGRMYSEELSSYMGTQVELLKSVLIQNRALAKVREQFPTTPTNELTFVLSARSSLKSSILEISATAANPEATRAYVDNVIGEYLVLKREARKKTSSMALSTITDQIGALEKQIHEKESEIRSFETTNNISFLTESGVSSGSHLARLNELLSDLRTEHRLLEMLSPDQFRDMSRPSAGPSTGVSVPGQAAAQTLAAASTVQESGYYQALQQLQILQAKRDEFAKVLRPTHSKMIKLSQEIDGLDHLLATLKDQGEQQATSQMASRKKSLELQIENLEDQYRAWQTNAAQASFKLAEHNRMQQELDRDNALYGRLLSLVQTVDLTKDLDQEALTQLAPASPAKPTLSRYKPAAAGILTAVVAGLGLLLVLGAADDRFSSATELSLHLPEEIVGQVPETSGRSNNGQTRLGGGIEQGPAFSESFRGLRSHLLCMTELPVGPKVIMVTSAVPKEGKTTIAANLGIAIARAGQRVLLIDADFRRSSLHRILEVSNGPGLGEVLAKALSATEAIVPTSEANLFLLRAGQADISGSELFLGRTIERVLEELRREYSYIIIDTAPVLATDDAATLGPQVHGTFVVVRASYTSSRMVRDALDRLNKRRVKVLGVIYNRAPQSTDYYSKYTHQYSSGNQSRE